MTKRIACIGAGTVGRAWAVVFARAGHEVTLHDADPAQVDRALPLIRQTLEQLDEDDPEAAMARIHPAANIMEAVRGAVFVQESVREDLAIKRAVVAEIASHAGTDAIIASSTSALPGSSFLGDLPRPERVLVAHSVNPPSLIPLVELCATPLTAPDVVEQTRSIMAGLGMRPVVLKKEIDGFLLNRLQFTLMAEALHLVGEGYCEPEDIDTVMTQGLALRWLTLGPFATVHLNASGGFAGFVEQLGPMMRRMGADARTDYDWDPALAERIHTQMEKAMPVEDLARWQAWRDSRIHANRDSQSAGEAEKPPE